MVHRTIASAPHRTFSEVVDVLRKHSSNESIRIAQQGHGRPIVSTKVGDYTIVATGNSIHWSKNWKTFTDFLSDYVKKTLGSEWGNAEIAKPLENRHPILQWYDAFCRYQATHKSEKKGELFSAPFNGVAHCYLGLAYNLYLLDHNVELQARFVARLKDIRQFQGAYYELIVANCMIRAGFRLELENEVDQSIKHCEFSAFSTETGIRYWVEAKMRSVPGVLGKTTADGSPSNDPTSQLTRHLSEALKKPAPDQRIIFVDLNAQPVEDAPSPPWLDQAVRRLDSRERDLKRGEEAYLFITNMAFHRALESTAPRREVLAHGLGIPDFGKPGKIRLSDWYRQKQKHKDAHKVIEALKTYPQIPDTFDGRPASEVFGKSSSNRLLIGETYFFEDIGEHGLVGKVSSVAVSEREKIAYVAVNSIDGKGNILKSELSDNELADYKKYGDAYFGDTENRHHESKDIFELYEFLVRNYTKTPRDKLLIIAKDRSDIERLKTLDQPDLVLEICEGYAASIGNRPSKKLADSK